MKDGSIYSGIVHTACFDNQHGIILKRAKMINKGSDQTHLDNESSGVVDTLVVSSADLVQVVVKGVLLPSQGIVSDAPSRKHTRHSRSSRQNENMLAATLTDKEAGDGLQPTVGKGQSKANSFMRAPEVENSKSEDTTIIPVTGVDERQAGKDQLKAKNNEPYQKFGSRKDTSIHEVQHNKIGSNGSLSLLQSTSSVDVNVTKTTSSGSLYCNPLPSLVKADAQDFERPTSTGSCSDVCSPSTESVNMSSQLSNSLLTSQTPLIAPVDSVSNANFKEFKLNPGAKTFMPMFSIPKSASLPTPTTAASADLIPDTLSVIPVAAAPQENAISHFLSHSSLPSKFAPNDNVVAISGDNAIQYSQPILANVGSRFQSVRYSSQYNPVQAAPSFVHPSPQTVMVSRFGQLVYMHPISHDLIQSSAVPTTVAVRPQLTPQVFVPKHQGSPAAQALQVCVTQPPFVVGGQQPYTMASHIPYSHPTFPVRPISVPGANDHFSTKFL